MLMLGNLYHESGCMERLSDTAQNSLMNIVTIMLATGTGMTMDAASFLNYKTILIIGLGLFAFAFGTITGIIFGKIMHMVDGVTNPLIGSAGVSAVPMAARVSQVVGQKYNPSNFLAHACHGAERGRRNRHGRSSRNHARHDWTCTELM
jgi:Na+-transporting methylmalonyl-CoA/oxaloacetate decarboxylase beta subunit